MRHGRLRAFMRFELPLVALRGISDGQAELQHVDDWTAYLHLIDEKLAMVVDLLGERLTAGQLLHADARRWPLPPVIPRPAAVECRLWLVPSRCAGNIHLGSA